MDKHDIVKEIAKRGDFAYKLVEAWFQADLPNRKKIEVAFEHLFKEVDPTFVAVEPVKRNRFKDADGIYNGGACNPIAVSNALAAAIKQVSDEGGGHDAVKGDGAIKMILDHLAFLCGMPQPSFRIDGWEQIVSEVVAKRTEAA